MSALGRVASKVPIDRTNGFKGLAVLQVQRGRFCLGKGRVGVANLT